MFQGLTACAGRSGELVLVNYLPGNPPTSVIGFSYIEFLTFCPLNSDSWLLTPFHLPITKRALNRNLEITFCGSFSDIGDTGFSTNLNAKLQCHIIHIGDG